LRAFAADAADLGGGDCNGFCNGRAVEPPSGIVEVAGAGDVVTLEHRPGEAAGHGHCHALGDAGAHQVADGGATEVVSKAKWDGNKLSISTDQPGRDGAPVTRVTVVTRNAGNMEVENQVAGGGGAPGGPGGGAPKQVYKKN